MTWSKSLGICLLATLSGLGLAWLVGSGSRLVFGLPLPVLCALLAFTMQWLAFVPARLARTEHFYDLWGATTYLTCIGVALGASGITQRGLLVAGLVALWALRLGSFLFLRVLRRGSDARFDHIKVSGPRFFLAWSLQGLWVSITLLAVLVVLGQQSAGPLNVLDLLGFALWGIGFAIEVIADEQKRRFRQTGPSPGFIASGLWAWSRHPNYFGEVLLWVGIAVVASSSMAGWSWLGLISPIFVFGLLRYGSGIPILEERSDRKFGHLAAYQDYVRNTPLLILARPR